MDFPMFSFFLSLLSVFSGNETLTVRRDPSIRQRLLPPTFVPEPTLRSLCPNEVNSTDSMLILMTRYHSLTRRCYMTNLQGPCGNNMKFDAVDDTYGECRCDQSTDRLLIYHKKSDQCYHIFQQGYCVRGFWLDINRQGRPVCNFSTCKNVLSSFLHKDLDLVMFKGECKEVGKPSRHCGNDEVVGFIKHKRSAACVPSRPMLSKAIGVPSTPCDIGSARALDGRCNPPFDFD